MNEQQIIDIFLRYAGQLTEASFWGDIMRNIGWSIIYGLYTVLGIVKGWQTQILDLLDFYNYSGLNTFITDYQTIAIGISVIVLVGVLIIFIYTNKHDYRGLFSNFIFGLFMMFALPLFVSMLNPIGRGVIGLTTNTEVSEIQVIRENLIDFRTVDQNGWQWQYDQEMSDDLDKQPNELSRGIEKEYIMGHEVTKIDDTAKNYLKLLKPAETIDSKTTGITSDGKDILSKVLKYSNGEHTLESGTAWWKPRAIETSYYRYHFRFWRLSIYFLIKIIVGVFLMWKLGMIIFEMNFAVLVGEISGLTDLRTGKRNVLILQTIINSLIVCVTIFILQRMYDIAWIFIDERNPDNFLFSLFLKAILTAFVMGGPNIIEKMFGIDAGVSSLSNSLMGLNQGMQLGKSLTAPIGNAFGKVKDGFGGLVNSGAKLAGADGGMFDAFKSLDDINEKVDDNPGNNNDKLDEIPDSKNEIPNALNSEEGNSEPNSDLTGSDIPPISENDKDTISSTNVTVPNEQDEMNQKQEVPKTENIPPQSTENNNPQNTEENVSKAPPVKQSKVPKLSASEKQKIVSSGVKETMKQNINNKINSIPVVKNYQASKKVTYDNIMNAYQEHLNEYQNNLKIEGDNNG